MIYQIDSNKKEPAYLQLYHYLVQDILDGVYEEGSKLPSKRSISEECGISVITVQHTMDLLSEEGYVEARERSGYFVIYRESDFYNAATRKEKTAPVEQIGHPPVGAFSYHMMAKTIRHVLLDYGEQILVKSSNQGSENLRGEICAYLARSRGITVRPEQVVVGSGAEYLYGLIAQLFGSGSRVAIEDPSYEKIRKVYETMGCVCEGLALSAEGIPTDLLRQTGARILHVTPFHSYPSGISIGISKKKEYLHWAAEGDRVIVEDNYDSELTVSSKPEVPIFSLAKAEPVIYLNTFSHTIAPGVRIGYMVLPETMVDVYRERLGFYSCPVPLFDQYVLTELLRGGDYERHINRERRRRRRALSEKNGIS